MTSSSPEPLRIREARLRAQHREVWERVRMAEEYRLRPRSMAHGRPVSFWLALMFLASLGAMTWLLVDHGLRALSAAGPEPDNIFADFWPGAVLVGCWCLAVLVNVVVLSKYRRLRQAWVRHRQGLAIALGDLRRQHAREQGSDEARAP